MIVRRLTLSAALACQAAAADVVFDGSLGPAGGLAGEMLIGEEWGRREGANLFHSFARFNVNPGESATFVSDFNGPTRNVIGRVTGGTGSLIDGPLRSAIPGAALWLINPQGIVFGQDAVVDVQGAFMAATADYLLLEDGGQFSASLGDASGTVLTMGNPAGFGFLAPAPAPIEVRGEIAVAEGAGVTLAAGGIEIRGGRIIAESGGVSLVAVASAGELGLGPEGPDTGAFDAFGDIDLNAASIDVSGRPGGAVYIVGGRFMMDRGASVTALSEARHGGDIRVWADEVSMRRGSVLDSSNLGSGRGGSVAVEAGRSVVISGGSRIDGSAQGPGRGGGVEIRAGERIAVLGVHPDTLESSVVSTIAAGSGPGGDMLIEAPVVDILDGGFLWGSARDDGDAGDITVNASERLTIAGYDAAQFASAIYATASGRGNAGNVHINAGDVDLLHGGVIQTVTRNRGQAGDIVINATGDLRMSGPVPFIAGGLNASSFNVGDAGSITIRARDVVLDDLTAIIANGNSLGSAGHIDMDVENLSVLNGALIFTENHRGGDPGSIDIDVADTLVIFNTAETPDSIIVASGLNGGQAGTIDIDARRFEMTSGLIAVDLINSDDSPGSVNINVSETMDMANDAWIKSISDNAPQGGGDINVAAGVLNMTADANISTNSFNLSRGAGTITVSVGELNMSESTIQAEACDCTSGSGGNVYVNVSGRLTISGIDEHENPSGIRSRTLGAGPGGNLFVTAGEIFISDGGGIISESQATEEILEQEGFPGFLPGRAGNVAIATGHLEVTSGGRISTFAIEAAGGVIALDVPGMIFLSDASVTAEAFGVTPGDDGGNVLIGNPQVIVMDSASILATANAGNGGNIGIAAEVLIPSLDSVIDASSQRGLDGEVVIDSPNQQVATTALLEAPSFDVTELVQDPCVVRLEEDRSSLTLEGRGGLPPAPDELQTCPVAAP